MSRRPEHAVVLSGRDAAILYQAAKLDDLRIRARSRDDVLYSILIDLHSAALAWRVSAGGNEPRKTAETAEHRRWWNTAQLARAAHVSPRTIRNHILDNRIPATREDGRWLIAAADARTYLATRTPN